MFGIGSGTAMSIFCAERNKKLGVTETEEKICAAQQKQKDAKRRAQAGFPIDIMEMWEWE